MRQEHYTCLEQSGLGDHTLNPTTKWFLIFYSLRPFRPSYKFYGVFYFVKFVGVSELQGKKLWKSVCLSEGSFGMTHHEPTGPKL